MENQCILEVNLYTKQSNFINDTPKFMKKIGAFEGEDDYISIKGNSLSLKVTKHHKKGIHIKIDYIINYLEKIILCENTKKIGQIYGNALLENVQLFACENKIYLVSIKDDNKKYTISVKNLKSETYFYNLNKNEEVEIDIENIIETNVALTHFLSHKK